MTSQPPVAATRVTVEPVLGLGEIVVGDDLSALITERTDLADGDVVVVAQKIISKAEGALVAIGPGESVADARRRLAREQAARVVVDTPGVLVVETVHGLVCANAGIDASNVPGRQLALLPDDPDASARRLRADFAALGSSVGVVVTDTFGRPWRLGQTDVAIGLAGLPAIRDERGGRDRSGRELEVTETALADEVAAAADLVRRKDAGLPVVVVRGLDWQPDPDATAAELQRGAASDLFSRGRGMLAKQLARRPAWPSPRVATPSGPPSAPADEPRRPPAPEATTTALSPADLELIGEVAAQAGARLVPVETASGRGTVRVVGDRLAAGLVTAALLDLGHTARWADTDAGLVVEVAEDA